jgi:glyoxylase-like metal-dependent hydrolase (beta-lactamase superfamily II)
VKVHHLNCGTVRIPTAPLVCHVLLLETDAGLVLVDTGFGLEDIAAPGRRIGAQRFLTRPALIEAETALRSVERLGFRGADVRHIVLTHLDADHIGGLADFPHASVHVTSSEVEGAMKAPRGFERIRYRRSQWSHGPKLVLHDCAGEPCFGFARAKELREIAPGIVLIPMPGHTRGHAAVAVDAGSHWILHAGDTFYDQGTLDGHSHVPLTLRLMEIMVAHDLKALRANQARLAELWQRSDPSLRIVCAHDPRLYASASAP